MYALIKNGSVAKYPYWPSDLKYENPNTSFPREMTDSQLAEFGMFPVVAVDRPVADYTKNISEAKPALQDGAWVQVWVVADANQDEVLERSNAQASFVRADRNTKLSATDWTQVADAPVDKEAWATYRQALRDVTAQPGFPWIIDWPTMP